MTEKDAFHYLRAVGGEDAVDRFATLRASLDSQPKNKHQHPPTQGQKGWMVGRLNDLCGSKDARHAFLWAAFGDESSKGWTKAHYDTLHYWLKDGGDEYVPDMAQAALRARNEATIEAGQSRMDEVLAQAGHTRKETDMTINVAALLSSVEKYGYEGAGDVMAALGIEKEEDFEGTPADALRILKENAPNPPQDEAPEPPDVEGAAREAREEVEAGMEEGHQEVGEQAEREVDEELVQKYLEQCSYQPESPVLAWTKFQRRPGSPVWTISLRAGMSPDTMGFALNEIMRATHNFEKWMYKNGYSAVIDGRDMTPGFGTQDASSNRESAPSKPSAPSAPSQPSATSGGGAPSPPPAPGSNQQAQQPAQAPQQGGNGGHPSGTDPLHKITVTAEGQVQFHVGNFRWPFKDSRGADVVANLFDPDLGWTAAHFVPGAKYEGSDVAGLVVDWEKPGKYYDVILIHR